MDREQFIKERLGKVSRQSYWLGIIAGLLLGFALGYFVGLGQGDQTIVVPLTEGVRV